MTTIAIIGYFVALFGIAAGALLLWDRLRAGRRESLDDRYAVEARLRDPQWNAVEAYTGRRISEALRRLYADTGLICRTNFWVAPPASQETRWHFATFVPADAMETWEHWYKELPAGSWRFATDKFGDAYFVRLQTDGEDSPVELWHHDGGDIEVVAASLEEFLKWLPVSKESGPIRFV